MINEANNLENEQENMNMQERNLPEIENSESTNNAEKDEKIRKKTFFSKVSGLINHYRLSLYNFIIKWAIITSHISCYIHIYQMFKIGIKPFSENIYIRSVLGFV